MTPFPVPKKERVPEPVPDCVEELLNAAKQGESDYCLEILELYHLLQKDYRPT